MKTKFLRLSIVSMCLLALLGLSTVFLSSLSPNTKSLELAVESGRSISLDGMESGSFSIWEDDFYRYFVLVDFDGTLRVYSVPYREGSFWIADLRWDRPFLQCNNFGPDANGLMLEKGGAFRCRDDGYSEFWKRESVWDYAGKSLGTMSADMPESDFVVRGDVLFLVDGATRLDRVSSIH